MLEQAGQLRVTPEVDIGNVQMVTRVILVSIR